MDDGVESLFVEVGEAVLQSRALPSAKPPRERLVEIGRQYLLNSRDKLCKALDSEIVKDILERTGTRTEEAIKELADIVAALTLGIPPRLTAKAMVILGRSFFCK